MVEADTRDLPSVTLVGVGASAGGLEAVAALIASLPGYSYLAFVVLQHLSPSHKSMLVEILERETALDVKPFEDGLKPEPGVIYVVPSSYNASVHNGLFRLRQAPPEIVPKPSINEFFISLAADAGEAAVGIVLSGTGSDGTAGLRAIQAAGGICIAQNPETAKYSGMPLSAIEAGVADFVFTPEEIAENLPKLVKGTTGSAEPVSRNAMQQLLGLLKTQCKVDFSGYKEGTLARRIKRRLVATGHETIESYLEWIAENKSELNLLSRDILISVTAFFRDPDAFSALRSRLEQLCEEHGTSDEIRIWVAGCASGEEAYSVAILLTEVLGDRMGVQPIQIFATDIDEDALNIARRGVYPAAALSAVSPERLNRFFHAIGKHFEVAKPLRDMIVFARHNLVDDPPFLRLDLVTCRNVLIYFDNPLQTRVLQRFHFALRSSGLLFLGRSESVAQAEQLFSAVGRRDRLFLKKGNSQAPSVPSRATGVTTVSSRTRWNDQVRLLLEGTAEYLGATMALCDGQGHVQHTAGKVDRFLRFPVGSMDVSIYDVVLEAFQGEVMALLHRFNKLRKPQSGRPRAFEGEYWQVAVCGVPGHENDYSIVIISPVPSAHRSGSQVIELARSVDGSVENELTATREHLQSLIEELATANEEMQSLNEEAQASNEELQATNEELEAANEELQATNEELVSLNEEHNAKTAELSFLNNEYSHLYDALEFPILVFDCHGALKRFNAPAARRLNLISSARNQPVRALRLPEYLSLLESMLQKVLAHGSREEQLVQGDGRTFQLSVTPGLNEREELQTLVVMLLDITDVVRAREDLSHSRSRLQTLMENTTVLLAMKDMAGRYLFANQRFLEAFSIDAAGYMGKSDFDLFGRDFAGSLWSKDLEALRSEQVIDTEHQLKGQRKRTYRTVHQVLKDSEGRPEVIINETEDITRRKEAEEQLRVAAKVFEQAGEAIVVTDASGTIQSINEAFIEITGYSHEDAMGANIGSLLRSGRHSREFYHQLWGELNTKGYWQGEIWNKRKSGEVYPEWLTINRIDEGRSASGVMNREVSYVAVFSDISNLKDSQRKVEFLATHDPLTKLPNRHLFQDRLEHALAYARRHDSHVALLFIDVDNFKSVNDTLGHDVGDQLLTQVAERLRHCLRDVDTVARVGGDEFTVILSDCSVEDAEFAGFRILNALSEHFQIAGRRQFVSASIGAAFYPIDAEDASGLIKAADTAMYQAKEEGRNRLRLFRPELRTELLQVAAIESALHEAIRREQLRIVIQPQYDAQEPSRLIGGEALLRWTDVTLGVVSPAEFIPVAEKTGLMKDLGRLVEKLVLGTVAGFRKRGLVCPTISMNVSAQSFRDEEFVERLEKQIEQHGLEKKAVKLEITEGALLSNNNNEVETVRLFRENGIELSIDDFGTGYSSLSYLKRLPLAELKIDKSFVDGLGKDENDEAIARAILALAKTLSLRTVAEGVETEEQLAWLQREGCDVIQGYLLSKPVTIEAFAEMLTEQYRG